MFWFNKPETVSEQAKIFLLFEKDWIQGPWGIRKSLLVLSVPVSFAVLGVALWKKNLWIGLAVVALIAASKIIWSIQNAGDSGRSIVIPALLGLLICVALIFYGFKRLEKDKNK